MPNADSARRAGIDRPRDARIGRSLLAVALVLFAAACTTVPDRTAELDRRHGPPSASDRLTIPPRFSPIDYLAEVKPIIDGRCVVCHACYDAACQLKLTAAAGIDRGGTDERVYAIRGAPADPTRLFVDERDTAGWRERGFHPVLNERADTVEAHRDAGVLAQLLSLKRERPLPVASNDPLPRDDFPFGLDIAQDCPTTESFPDFARRRPFAGMPYALPGLDDAEAATLARWIDAGAPLADPPPVDAHRETIAHWEAFLNGSSNEERLIARYVFEHLFLAHIHLPDIDGDRPAAWYRLVRSSTPPGEPIVRIATRRPYDDPGVARVWYRLWQDPETIVAKNHLPYAFDAARMAWLRALFHDADFAVDTLPGYRREVASNPFLAFDALPVTSRYRFMLEEARFTIMGFMKGPVCRGQVALNVIQDHFWVFFVDPENNNTPGLDGLLMEQAHNLEFPAASSGFGSLLGVWTRYAEQNRRYLDAKMRAMSATRPDDIALGLDYVWDGDGVDPDAALTVYRHHDSASVTRGLTGGSPKTAWLINYPLLERIHYLLVAEFDVFGNLGHQLATRLYMDFLRQEGELAFLTLLPRDARDDVLHDWYRDTDETLDAHMSASMSLMDGMGGMDDGAMGDSEGDAKRAIYEALQARLDPVLERKHELAADAVPAAHLAALRRIGSLDGPRIARLPEVSLLSVEDDDGTDHVYSVLRHRARSHLNSVFTEGRTLLPDEDELTVLRGVVGDYPDAFWHVRERELDAFERALSSLDGDADYAALMKRFGIRRSHDAFWAHADRLHEAVASAEPIDGGLLDLNRLENR